MNKKTVVITGSTRGIGHGLALQFLQRGHRVVIHGRSMSAVESKVQELRSKNYEVTGAAGDITQPDTFRGIIEETLSAFDKIDIWINNAGIPQSNIYFHTLDDHEIEKVISVNVTGMMLGTKAALNFFKKQGYGKIFNMEGFGSDGRMMDKLAIYGTSKRAVNYFTKAVSKETHEKTIQVGILSPGMVRTDFLKDSMTAGSEEENARTRKAYEIIGEEVGPVTEYLAKKILVSEKQYDRINYLTFPRLFPKIIKMAFAK